MRTTALGVRSLRETQSMKIVILITFALLILSGCMGMGDYQAAEQGVASIDPRKIEVNPDLYPTYSVTNRFSPPRSYKIPSKEDYFKKREAERIGWNPHPSLPRVEDKEAWRAIDESSYSDLMKRSKWAEILPSDVWRVTYVYKGLYLVYSEQYQKRECERELQFKHTDAYLENGECHHIKRFLIYLKPSGEVAGGFKILNRDSVFASQRRMPMEPDHTQDNQWNEMVHFKANSN